MNRQYQEVSLKELLVRRFDTMEVLPLETYRRVTIRMYGVGISIRDVVIGSEINTKSQFYIRTGQFLLSKIDARNGAFGIVPDECDGAIITGNFWTFDVNHERLNISFLNYLTRTDLFVKFCIRASEGTTNRKYLREDRFLAQTIPLPPLDEQRRIVAHIDALAARIAEVRGLRAGAVEEAKAFVNSEACSIFSGIEIGITELSEWTDKKREGIQTGPFGAMLGTDDFLDEGYPIITIGNVQYEGLRLKGLKFISENKARELQRYMAQTDDILFARMGTVGRCCVVPPEANGWIFNYHIIRVAPDHSRINSRYIHWIIQASPDIEQFLEDNIRGATREGVNTKIVGKLPCRVPDLDEQRRIVAYLDSLQAEVERLQHLQAETAAELDALLPSLLDRAFRGEL